MVRINRTICLYALDSILLPAVRFAIRHSLKIQDFTERTKAAFIKVAKEELSKRSQEVNLSRLSVITGMHRRDTSKFKDGVPTQGSEKDLISKIVGQWQSDRKYLSKERKPRILDNSEFNDLVRSISTDLKPGAVLFELERIKAVSHVEGGLRLEIDFYIPEGDIIAGLDILRKDINDLVSAVEENIFTTPHLPNHHLRAEYDRVREDVAEAVKIWLLREGHAFQLRVRDYLANYDQDANPDPNYKGKYIRVMFGTFGRIDKGDL